MRGTYLIIGVFAILTSCISTRTLNNPCSKGKISIQSKKKLFLSKKKKFILMFLDGFNGDTKVYLDDKEIFNKNISTEFSTGFADMIDFELMPKQLGQLKIMTANNCMIMDINKKYRVVQVYDFKQKWNVVLSNQKHFSFE